MSEKILGLSVEAVKHLESMYGIKIEGTKVVSLQALKKKIGQTYMMKGIGSIRALEIIELWAEKEASKKNE